MKTLKPIAVLLALLVLFTMPSCELLEQSAQVQRLRLCTFDVSHVDQVKLAGIHLRDGMDYGDLNAAQIMTLTGALMSRNLPLDFNLNVKVDNPNDKTAAMSRMDYTIFVDGLQLVSGVLNQRYEIAPGQSVVVPMRLQLELFQALSGETGDALVNLAFKLTGDDSRDSELLFRVKPYIRVSGRELAYPGYLDVNHTL